jgi:hypothetical protein
MSEVYNDYVLGRPHRLVMRPEDFHNFRNYLLETFKDEDVPNPVADSQLAARPNYKEHEGKQVPGR